jgi:hypothetical protein
MITLLNYGNVTNSLAHTIQNFWNAMILRLFEKLFHASWLEIGAGPRTLAQQKLGFAEGRNLQPIDSPEYWISHCP